MIGCVIGGEIGAPPAAVASLADRGPAWFGRPGRLAGLACCASLRPSCPNLARHPGPPVQLEGRAVRCRQRRARHPRPTASRGQDTGIFDRHLALEEAIVGSPLTAANRVVLLQDGPDTYRAMLAAILAARTTSTWRPTSWTTTMSASACAGADRQHGRVFRSISSGQRWHHRHAGRLLRSACRPTASRCWSSIHQTPRWRAKVGSEPARHRKLLVVDGRTASWVASTSAASTPAVRPPG